MNFKKKRSFRDLLRAALVVLFFIGVPVWLLMIALITDSVIAAGGLICWCLITWIVGRRFE